MNNYAFETLTLEHESRGVARLTLNRPAKHNALNKQMIDELRRAAERVAEDERVRVVVLGGAGRSFCAGGDIGWFRDTAALARDQRVRESRELACMLRDLNDLPKPLIARVHGSVYGGGVGMVSVCDLAIAAQDVRLGLTEVRLGLIPANISPYVVARIGVARARATMLSGELFDAAHAERIGLIDEAVAPAQLHTRIEQVVAAHLEAAPGAVADTKRLIADVAACELADVATLTAERLADAWESEEGRVGVDCFLGRQRPPWRSER